MEQTNIFKNKFYLVLLGSWLFLYILQASLFLAGVQGNVLVYILAVVYALTVAVMLAVGYVRREKIFLLLAVVSAAIQVVLFLFSIPAMVTGENFLPRILQCIFYVPGYGLLTGAYGWRWAFAVFWGVILCGAVEGLWKKICSAASAWFRRTRGTKADQDDKKK